MLTVFCSAHGADCHSIGRTSQNGGNIEHIDDGLRFSRHSCSAQGRCSAKPCPSAQQTSTVQMAGTNCFLYLDFIFSDWLHRYIQRYHRLQDIKKLLATFKSIASHVVNVSDQNFAPIDATLQQLKDLAEITKDVDRSRVLENILIAAMNLRQILLQTDTDEFNSPGELAVTLSKHERYILLFIHQISCS